MHFYFCILKQTNKKITGFSVGRISWLTIKIHHYETDISSHLWVYDLNIEKSNCLEIYIYMHLYLYLYVSLVLQDSSFQFAKSYYIKIIFSIMIYSTPRMNTDVL